MECHVGQCLLVNLLPFFCGRLPRVRSLNPDILVSRSFLLPHYMRVGDSVGGSGFDIIESGKSLSSSVQHVKTNITTSSLYGKAVVSYIRTWVHQGQR